MELMHETSSRAIHPNLAQGPPSRRRRTLGQVRVDGKLDKTSSSEAVRPRSAHRDSNGGGLPERIAGLA